MPDWAPASRVVAGAALDSAGDPQLVLDPDGLREEAERGRSASDARRETSTILVIDDSLTTRMLEQSILESAGYEVDLAASAEEALQMATAKAYALFLVDVEMPGMDGFTYIQTVRADPDLRHIPALLVSSLDAPEHKERGRAVGAQGYIVKGEFDQRDLLDRIRRLL
jgi:two-component system chemotaxis sensor kinase CheA